MRNIDIEKMNYDELLELIERATLLLDSKKLEKERNEIKEKIFALVETYLEKGGDRGELLNSLSPSSPKEPSANTEIESIMDVVLMDKEQFHIGCEKNSGFKIEDVLNGLPVNQILQEGNTSKGRETFPDPETSRVVNPRGLLPCITTGGSCLVDVKDIEAGVPVSTTTDAPMEAVAVKKKPGRKGVPILQFTLDGKFVKEWENASSAESSLGMSHQSIGKAARGENNHKSGGYLWYRKDDPQVMVNNAA